MEQIRGPPFRFTAQEAEEIDMNVTTYMKVRQLREQQMKTVSSDPFKLNQFHDEIMLRVIKEAINKTAEEYGPVPGPFSFFVMGSAGRSEQAIWSDQDNGIIYKETRSDAKEYFLLLGKEISKGLYEAGYEYCDGHVMASNPFWCKSFFDWKEQIRIWIEQPSWESIRNLLIFIDCRSLYGESEYVYFLKKYAYDSIHEAQIMARILHNTMNLKKGIGILGQFLTETHGIYAGALNIKDKILFPYINAVRLLAIQEQIFETSTLSRLDHISSERISSPEKEKYKKQFIKLLYDRLQFVNQKDYQSSHYLFIHHLNKEQQKELKEIIKTGLTLYQQTRRMIEKEG